MLPTQLGGRPFSSGLLLSTGPGDLGNYLSGYFVRVAAQIGLTFSVDRGAGDHGVMKNRVLLNQCVLNWLEDVSLERLPFDRTNVGPFPAVLAHTGD